MCCAELGSGNAQRQRVYITVIFQCIRPVLCMRCVCIRTVRCGDPVRTSGTLRLGPHQLLISSVAPAIGVPEPAGVSRKSAAAVSGRSTVACEAYRVRLPTKPSGTTQHHNIQPCAVPWVSAKTHQRCCAARVCTYAGHLGTS